MGAERRPGTPTQRDASERYIVGRMAQWAGDFDYALKLYADVVAVDVDVDARMRRNGPVTPEGFMREAARLRKQQISAKIGEFKHITEQAKLGEFSYQPLIIETAHLRGAVWRHSVRWLQLRAYMSDLSWTTELKARSGALLERYGGLGGGVEGAGMWSLGGNPFVTVTLSDRCLLQADAHWVSVNFPENAIPFIEKFRRVMADLDEKPTAEEAGRTS